MNVTLRTALDDALEGLAPRAAAGATGRLIAQYRGATPTGAPVLRDHADAVAYAAYRMPATYEAARAALTALAAALPDDWAPGHHLDLGGGTGAAAWAASDVFGGERPVTVLDWAGPALALGRDLAAGHPLLHGAQWRAGRLGTTEPVPHPEPAAGGLVTLSYVLGELTGAAREAAVRAALDAAGHGAVVVVEPGTPDGYARILAARALLTAAGWTIAAPCPHSAACPIAPGTDWCHFSARVARSSLHRQVKGGTLPYEDEKYSYAAAVHPSLAPVRPAGARVLRRPQLRKGHVLLELCAADGTLPRVTVTKRQGPAYRAARGAEWGGAWEADGG